MTLWNKLLFYHIIIHNSFIHFFYNNSSTFQDLYSSSLSLASFFFLFVSSCLWSPNKISGSCSFSWHYDMRAILSLLPHKKFILFSFWIALFVTFSSMALVQCSLTKTDCSLPKFSNIQIAVPWPDFRNPLILRLPWLRPHSSLFTTSFTFWLQLWFKHLFFLSSLKEIVSPSTSPLRNHIIM